MIISLTSQTRLDIIGKVALGHDFKSGQSVEAQEIAASWHGVITMVQTFGAFVAQLVLRAFPIITSLPIPALRTPGVVKVTCGKLSRRLLDRGVISGDKSKDILSILMRANLKESGRGLTEEQIIANVSYELYWPELCTEPASIYLFVQIATFTYVHLFLILVPTIIKQLPYPLAWSDTRRPLVH